MKRWILLAMEFCKKRWLLVTCVIVLLFALAGIAPAYAAIQRAQQPQKHQGYQAQDNINAEDETDQEQTTLRKFSSTGSCGVERWSVKTGTDADAGRINLQSTTQTTIASLDALPAPSTLPANNRVQPTETTVFQLHDTLVEYKLETDSDYHLVLQDTSGKTLITEIPDPACVGASSPLLAGIQKARSTFDTRFTPTSSFQTANVPVTITGIGFFDFLHGQTGVAPNGIELHAVIDIQFGTGGTPTPSSTPTPTPSSTPTPTPIPGGSNILTNSGFESGSSSWTESSSGGFELVDSSNPHTGSNSANLCGYNSCADTIYQTITIPSSATKLTMSYWLYINTNETSSSTCYDFFRARLRTSSGTTISTLQTRCNIDVQGWTHYTFDVTSALSSYKGQQVQIAFLGTTDSVLPSTFYVDDVALTVQ